MEKQTNENASNNLKKRINEIDNYIINEKRRIKRFNDIQEEAVALSKNLNRCIELLSTSIKSKEKENMLKDMYDSNKSFYINFTSALDEEISSTRKKINKLSQEKDNIIKENKNKKE